MEDQIAEFRDKLKALYEKYSADIGPVTKAFWKIEQTKEDTENTSTTR